MANVSSSNGLEKCPKLRFPGFDEPWKMVSLQDISEYRKNKICVSKLKYISTENMLQNFAGIIPYTSEEDISGVEFCVGDTLLANIRPYLRKAWLATHDGACSTDVLALCPSDITPAFLNNIIEQDRFIDYVMSGVKGSKMPRGDKAHILAYETAIPSLLEQEKINSFMQLLHQRIAKIQMEIELLKKYKRGLLSREFGQQENGVLNNRYVGKLKDYFHLSSGSTPSSTNRAFYSGNIRWVSSGELKPKYLCETSQHISSEAVSSCNLREYPANTLLVAMYGLEAAGVRGTASILSVPATISQACMAIQQTGEIDIEYLYYWYIYNGQWIGIQIAQGTKQHNLSTDTLGNLRIHAPSCSKQKKVCKLLSQIDYLIEKECKKIDLLSSVKRGLLQQLFI